MLNNTLSASHAAEKEDKLYLVVVGLFCFTAHWIRIQHQLMLELCLCGQQCWWAKDEENLQQQGFSDAKFLNSQMLHYRQWKKNQSQSIFLFGNTGLPTEAGCFVSAAEFETSFSCSPQVFTSSLLIILTDHELRIQFLYQFLRWFFIVVIRRGTISFQNNTNLFILTLAVSQSLVFTVNSQQQPAGRQPQHEGCH